MGRRNTNAVAKKSPQTGWKAGSLPNRKEHEKEAAWSGGRSKRAGKPLSRRSLTRLLNIATTVVPAPPPMPDDDEPLPFEVVSHTFAHSLANRNATGPEMKSGQFELTSKLRAVADAVLRNGCWLIFKCHEAHAVYAAARIANQLKRIVSIRYCPERESLVVFGVDAREDWPEYEDDGK